MSYYKKCLECGEINPSHALDREIIGRSLVQIGHCPECGFDRFEDVEGICNECEKALAEPDDDYCAACRDVMDERDFELDLIAARIEIPSKERRERELLDVITAIARGTPV